MNGVAFNFGEISQKMVSSCEYFTRNYGQVWGNLYVDHEVKIGQTQKEFEKEQEVYEDEV